MAPFYAKLLLLSLLTPFLTFWYLTIWGGRMKKPAPGWIALVGGMGIPLALSLIVLAGWWMTGETGQAEMTAAAANSQWTWAMLGNVPVMLGVKLDSLTVAMHFMVCFIAFWIFWFSIGYMAGHSDEVAHQSKYHRFFAYLSLFAFSMLGLVISTSLLFLFIFWELVGLCSYLLIGYYFDKAYATNAAMKAFITNRIGDFGFIVGLMLVFLFLNTLDLEQAAATLRTQYANFMSRSGDPGIFGSTYTLFGWSLATIMGVGLFCGAMGKSAQFPLHVWLPDAMAGPTPVSALIHAATMVAAGVYLVARVYRLLTPDAQMFIALIGCITLTLMALVAIVQTDIKKCLAYSTLSQLGYMIFGMGVGAWTAALFHLITHAFFKAMLFLGSGQVIEGCHHEQNMLKMGGLWRKMPKTAFTFAIGVLAIAGAGIPGWGIGLGGYFSKDEILAVAYDRSFNWDRFTGRAEQSPSAPNRGEAPGHDDPSSHEAPQGRFEEQHGQAPTALSGIKLATFVAEEQGHEAAVGGEHHALGNPEKIAIAARMPKLPPWMFWLAIITAYVTPFYMFRCWWLTFGGKPRDHHVYDHAHESPMMTTPLLVLAAGTVISSYFLFRPLISDAAALATDAAMVVSIDGEAHQPAPTLLGLDHSVHGALAPIVGFAFVAGFALAFAIYRSGTATAERIRSTFPFNYLHLLLEKKYFFDELYDFVWVRGCRTLAMICGIIDAWIVDFIFNLLAGVTERFAAFCGRILDAHGVDGFMNGLSETAFKLSSGLKQPQNGRIRHYLAWSVGLATVAAVVVLTRPWEAAALQSWLGR